MMILVSVVVEWEYAVGKPETKTRFNVDQFETNSNESICVQVEGKIHSMLSGFRSGFKVISISHSVI